MKKFNFKVGKSERNTKLLDFLRAHFQGEFSTRALKRFIDQGWCRINGKVERHSTARLYSGALIDIQTTSEGPQKRCWEKSRILYEDSKLLAYNKPAGVRSDGPGLASQVQAYCQQAILLHRLDKETSGVLLFAKSSEAHIHFVEEFRKGAVKKSYLAIVDRCPKEKQGTIKSFLGPKEILEGQKRWGSVGRKEGKEAVTLWKTLKKGPDATLIQCHPITGRTHQLRVHCAEMSHPILGDALYAPCSRSKCPAPRLLLHAYEISIPGMHGEKLPLFRAPVPDDFIAALHYIGYEEPLLT